MAIACATTAPRLPDAPNSSTAVVGVAWYDDDRDGVIGAGELPASGREIWLGSGRQRLNGEFSAVTDDHGGFVIDLGVAARSTQLFAEVTLPTSGPTGGSIDVHQRIAVTADQTDVHIPIVKPLPCATSLDQITSDPTLCGTTVLPDLVPIVELPAGSPPTSPVGADSTRIDTTSRPGRTLLRLSSATANLGDGPLHMIPGATSTSEGLATWQRVWTDRNQFLDLPTGEFVFHKGHDHFHLANFERYRLLTPTGNQVAVGEKISFCLIDSIPAVDDPPPQSFGVFPLVACQQAEAQQALNPGWADYYGSNLPDQWIDITGVEPGNYLVEIVVDPDAILIESDETNNRATFPITIKPDQ